MKLAQRIMDAVDLYWATEVQVLGVWHNGPTVAYVVYRRTIDPTLILGQVAEFLPGAADGTVNGYARDVAINLAEPIGSQISSVRKDQYGIVWVAVPEDRSTPTPPSDVLKQLPLPNIGP